MHLIDRRIGLIFAVFVVALIIGATKAAWLGVVKADSLQRAAVVQQEADLTIPARRGAIEDVNGVDLGVSEPAMDIAATPRLVTDARKAAARLAPIIDRDETTILQSLARRDTNFVYLGRNIPQSAANKAKKLKIPGLEFTPRYRRDYPRDWMASQLLGTVGTDGNGLAGLEYTFEKQLRGTDGQRRMVKDAKGDPLEIQNTKPVKSGKDVRLTLDANLQDQAEAVLAEVGEKWKPKGATAILMDPEDGSILALANWPRVNANEPDKAPAEVNINRAVGTNYEPGSTFKAFTVAAALEEGKVTPNTSFPIESIYMYADRELKDAEDLGLGSMTTSEILKYSSNIGAVKIASTLGGQAPFDRWIRRFGFGKATGVDLPGEQIGIVPALKDYSGASMGNLPIGQGLSVTAMQMMAAYAAIANGGVLRPPHIVESVGGKKTKTPAGKRILSEATSASVRKMLEAVTGAGGTAAGAHIPGYTTAGKTGTAEKAINGEYSKQFYVASFVGFAPAKNPKVLAAVIVDEPEGDIYGGQVAAPAWKQIVNNALNYKQIAPE